MSTIKIKKPRCPKGTRRNNKTGECEEILRKQSGLPIEVSQIKNDSYKEPNKTPIISSDHLPKKSTSHILCALVQGGGYSP